MNEKLYLETSGVSYYTSRPSNEIIVLARQRITEQWWNTARNKFQCYISQAVFEEAGAGDPEAAKKRLEAIKQFPLLDIDNDVVEVYEIYLKRLQIPKKALRDAVHLAVSAVHAIDYLVTWNCTHIANGEIIKQLIKINIELGLSIPVIVTPEELMEV